MIRLPEDECAFYYAAMAQLEPELRPVFVERVANILGAYSPFCEPGPGDVDRAIRQALVGLWIPPATEEARAVSRWDRSDAGFDRVSRMARPREEKRRQRTKLGFGYVPAP
jgi:hypothetical protein